MTRDERQKLIDRYAAGAHEVVKSLEGFAPAGWTAHPIPGKWSAREIVHHLADSESLSGIRLRKLLTEERPILQGYDQDHYAVRLRYNERDPAPALETFRGVRAATTQLLKELSEEDWARQGWHAESGLYTVETWLRIYSDHAHNHAAQILRLREALK